MRDLLRHDEADYFPEACCVSSSDEPFKDACEETFNNIEDAINLWCSLTGISKDGRDQEQMMEFINEYEYDDKDTYFNIHPFAFE